MGMSIDECIAYLENVVAEKKPRSRKARRIIEHLKELKRYKETAAGYGARTERDSFYYGQGYKDGRKELVDELMGKLSEEVNAVYLIKCGAILATTTLDEERPHDATLGQWREV